MIDFGLKKCVDDVATRFWVLSRLNKSLVLHTWRNFSGVGEMAACILTFKLVNV